MTRAATVSLEAATTGDVYHAIACQPLRIGYVVCAEGEPLCGTTTALLPCPDGLYPPQVTCHTRAAITVGERISVAGTVSP